MSHGEEPRIDDAIREVAADPGAFYQLLGTLRRGHPLWIAAIEGLKECAVHEVGPASKDLDPRVRAHRALRAAMQPFYARNTCASNLLRGIVGCNSCTDKLLGGPDDQQPFGDQLATRQVR